MHITACVDPDQCRKWGNTIINAGATCCGVGSGSFLSSGPTAYCVLLTCSDMYHEARLVFASSTGVHLSNLTPQEFATILKAAQKKAFLRFAAPLVKHVSSERNWFTVPMILREMFTDVQLISFGPFRMGLSYFYGRGNMVASHLEDWVSDEGLLKWTRDTIATIPSGSRRSPHNPETM